MSFRNIIGMAVTAMLLGCGVPAGAAEIVVRWEGTAKRGVNPSGFFGFSVSDLAGRPFVATYVIDTTAGDFDSRGSEANKPDFFRFKSETLATGFSNPIKSSSLTINGFTYSFQGRFVSYYDRQSAKNFDRSRILTQALQRTAPWTAQGYFNYTSEDILFLSESPEITAAPIPYGGFMETFTRRVGTSGTGSFQRLSPEGTLLFGGELTPETVSVTSTPDPAAFRPIAPCRALDTRTTKTPIGVLGSFEYQVPSIVPRRLSLRGVCGLPDDATAYSLNITVVPGRQLGFLTVYPNGQPQPLTSTLNALDGRIKANAVVVPAGPDGALHLFATDSTDVIVDVNGAFVPERTNPQASPFYTVAPCRILSTAAPAGGGALQPNVSRSVIVANASGCGIPSNASAFALNVTVVPKTKLGFLTLWPDNGAPRPLVSTLNALTGAATANLAIVPAGPNGAIQAFATEATELIVDITGYFAPPGGLNALSFYSVPPCRTLDTRLANGPVGGPILVALGTRSIPAAQGGCAVAANSRAYSLNATVVPSGPLGFLTLFPTGVNLPLVSTLNAVDGSITSNAAFVPADASPRSEISAYVTEQTHLILDISGYFAPRMR